MTELPTSVISKDGEEYIFSNGVWMGDRLAVVNRLNLATEYIRIVVLGEGYHADPHKVIVDNVLKMVPGTSLVYHKGEKHVPGRIY